MKPTRGPANISPPCRDRERRLTTTISIWTPPMTAPPTLAPPHLQAHARPEFFACARRAGRPAARSPTSTSRSISPICTRRNSLAMTPASLPGQGDELDGSLPPAPMARPIRPLPNCRPEPGRASTRRPRRRSARTTIDARPQPASSVLAAFDFAACGLAEVTQGAVLRDHLANCLDIGARGVG